MKFLRKLFSVVAVALAAGPALAAVTGSHHDLTNFESGARESCLYCHGVTKAGAASTAYGNVGDLCLARCHVGGAFVTDTRVVPNIPASIDQAGAAIAPKPTVNAVRTDSGYAHGLTKSQLVSPFGGTTAEAFSAAAAGFPYQANADIECTTCHDVHSNANTPFLQANLFTGGTTARPSFCEACHTTRGNSWAAGTPTSPNGEHPTNFALVLGTVQRGTVGVSTGAATRRDRYINLDQNIFDQATANGTGLNGLTGQYITGGKVSGFGNAAGGETFGCYTCHGVHVPVTMGAGSSWQAPNLILRDATSTDGTWNPICTGCHGSQATGLDDPNPGLSGYYHPVGSGANAGSTPVAADGVGTGTNVYSYLSSTGTFRFSVSLDVLKGTGMALVGIADTVVGIETTSHRPRCGSCHDVHGGLTDSMALVDLIGARDGANTTPTASKICDSCHTGIGLPDMTDDGATNNEPANSHHRTRTGTWATATVADQDTNTLNLDGANSASWLTAADHTNGLDCADCHVFDGTTHSTAHNW